MTAKQVKIEILDLKVVSNSVNEVRDLDTGKVVGGGQQDVAIAQLIR